MKRRHFVTSMLAASASASALRSAQPSTTETPREYYELRRYQLESGPQGKLTNHYLDDALIPALNRIGIKPVGVFNLDIGVHSPSIYVLIPSNSLETLVSLEARLAGDHEYLSAGEPFLNATSKAPAFMELENFLMAAFEGTKLTVPPARNGKRVFELRTYYSPSHQAHLRKVEMFHSGEFDVFKRAGFWQVFFGDKLVGPRLPNLTYMLSFPDISEMNANWEAFRDDPQWKKLTSDPRFNYDQIVTSIDNLILTPARYSQI